MLKYIRFVFLFFFGAIFGVSIFVSYQNFQKYETNYKELEIDTNKIFQNMQKNINISESKYSRFDEIYEVLSNDFWSGWLVNSGDMIINATKSFVDTLGDPYTVYLDVEENKELWEALEWTQDFEWIWAYISKKDDGIIINEIIKNSPAHKAWLLPLDLIVIIEWESTKTMSVWDAVSKIRWPAGTSVKIKIIRNTSEWQKLLEKTVIRDKVEILSVKSEIVWSNIWHLTISSVWENTAFLFAKELKFLLDQKINWLILDLRWNNGWYLEIAVDICSYFLPKNEIVVVAKYPKDQKVYKSKWLWSIDKMPIVILVDGMTASAGEIIAMALSEKIWAKIIWTKTFGKWSIQTIHTFEDNSSLKYTVGKRYSPNDINIDWTWFVPTIEIQFDMTWYNEKNIDNQLQTAIEQLWK